MKKLKKISDFFSKNKENKKEKKNTEMTAVEKTGDMSLRVPFAEKKKPETASTPVSSRVYTYVHGFDRPMFIIILLLSFFGLIMVYSSSYVYALTYMGNGAHFAIRQAIFLVLGISIMLVITMFGYKIIKLGTLPAYALALVLLLLVLIIGVSEGDAKRWIYIGPVSFQPSEFMKITMILMVAWFSSKFKSTIHSNVRTKKAFWKASLFGTFIPAAIIGVSCLLVLLENHLSGAIILFLIGFAILWSNGSPKVWTVAFAIFVVAAVAFVIFAVTNKPDEVKALVPNYMFVRVDSWLHPENYSTRDELWQTIQGQIAIGSGGFFGRGFGQSLQKHLFVSMPQNDFIFAIVCEEMGFIGAVTVIGLYMAFVARGLHIARNSPDVFCAVTATGISAHVGFQAILNIAVVTGLIPNTGISLPFFSAGGSSLIFLFIEMGILLCISKYTPVYETDKKRIPRKGKSER